MGKKNPDARPINQGLTKQMLLDMGIHSIVWDEESNQWHIYREWFKCGKTKEKTLRRMKIVTSKRYHKYSNDTIYQTVCFFANNRCKQISLQRLLYCWFIQDIPDGYVIDHIDDNQFNNKLENLQMLTPEENQAKRYLNPNNCKNQWDYCKIHGLTVETRKDSKILKTTEKVSENV